MSIVKGHSSATVKNTDRLNITVQKSNRMQSFNGVKHLYGQSQCC